MNPCIKGRMAPPTIAKQRIPEPSLVRSPNRLTPRLKMTGNMIELNKPIDNTAHIAISPAPKTVTVSKIQTVSALNARSVPPFIFCINAAPIKRPTIAPAQ